MFGVKFYFFFVTVCLNYKSFEELKPIFEFLFTIDIQNVVQNEDVARLRLIQEISFLLLTKQFYKNDNKS